jgi:hypothetical protein
MDGQRLYRGRVDRVASFNSIDAEIDLTLGVFIRKLVIVDGFNASAAEDKWSAAQRCLVTICGGESVLIYTDGSRRDGHIVARIFVPKYGNVGDSMVEGMPHPMVELLPWMNIAVSYGFDHRILLDALRKARRA